MANKKGNRKPPTTDRQAGEKPSKNPGLESGEIVGLGVAVGRRYYDALAKCAEAEGRKKRAVIERALDAYFRASGFWKDDEE